MRYFIFTLCCFLSFALCAQDGVSIRLNDFATIEFPSTPEFTERESRQVYTYQDSLGIYMAMVSPLTASQNALMINRTEITNLYTGTAKGGMDATNGSLVSSEVSYYDGIPFLDIEFTTPYNEKLPSVRLNRFIYTNPDVILIAYWPLVEDQNQIVLQKLKFFNSLELDETQVALIQEQLQNDDSTRNVAYMMGRITGMLIVFGIIVGFIVLVIWLIRRLTRKKKVPVKTPEKTRPIRPIVNVVTCKNCGAQNKSNFKYCVKCGYEL